MNNNVLYSVTFLAIAKRVQNNLDLNIQVTPGAYQGCSVRIGGILPQTYLFIKHILTLLVNLLTIVNQFTNK